MVRCWLLSTLLLGLTGSAVRAEEPAAFARDVRFSRPVSLSRERISLGELVEKIRSRTGAPIEVDDGQAPVSGMPLTVHLEEQPARQVLAGLRELLATPYLSWSWEAKPDGNYRLRPSAAPGVAASRARRAASERFAVDFRALYAAAHTPAAQLEQQVKLHPEYLLSPRDYPDRLAFVQALTAQQVDKIVAGEKVELRAEELPPDARKVLRLGTISPLPPEEEPKSGSLQLSWQGGSPAEARPRIPTDITLGPVLWLESNLGKTNFFGGTLWDRNWLRQIAPEWQAHGSPVIQDWLKRQVKEMKDPEPLTASSAAGITLEAARRRHLNLLVDFAGSDSEQFASIPLPTAAPDNPLLPGELSRPYLEEAGGAEFAPLQSRDHLPRPTRLHLARFIFAATSVGSKPGISGSSHPDQAQPAQRGGDDGTAPGIRGRQHQHRSVTRARCLAHDSQLLSTASG